MAKACINPLPIRIRNLRELEARESLLASTNRIGRMSSIELNVPQAWKGISGCFCSVCESAVDDFIPGGVVKQRSRARCPVCRTLERHRFMALYFKSNPRVLMHGERRILHVAPERPVADILSHVPGVSYLSADLSGKGVMVQMDLTDIQYSGASFDLIVCSHVLEHIPDDSKAMAEMFRVLSPGGVALIQVPLYGDSTYEDFSITSEEGRLAAFGQKDHVRKYGSDIDGRLRGAGFDVRSVVLPGDADLCYKLGLKKTPLFECVKVS